MDWLTDPLAFGATTRALIEIAILGTVGAAVGCWVILYRLSYSAESLAHGLFPGLVGAALLGLPILLGGAAGVLLAAALIALVNRFATDDADTATAVVVTTLFGLGVLLALSPESPPGISELLFGDLLGTTDSEIIASAAFAAPVIVLLWLLHSRLLAVGFDQGSGPALGVSPGLMTGLVLSLVAVTVLIGVQALGNLLVAAILVGPAAAARLLTDRFRPMMMLSVVFALLAGLAGIYISFHAKIAAGAAVAGCLVMIYLLAAAASAVAERSFGRTSLNQ
ncbi:MAG: metal ABC transporter permease [Solirubrobacterales bacterium]|nr:metal ABC transporter permease [Solirubrobacterales bacterium]